ncbi:MAG: hypothetical protein KAS17_09250, partial [Victivallaceae bacterium]|nr:hypothetical protein [Victivallaceae bacterium]
MQNSLKDYKSNFSWRNDTIYDGDSPIASFRHGGNEDLSFQDVVLKPGGEPVIKWVVSWQAQFKNFTNVLEKAVINDEDHERLKMEFVSHSPNKYYSSHVEMELTYNSQTKSYQYEVETVLTVNKFPFATWGEFCEKVSSYVLTIPTEYANIWPLRPCEFENWIYKNVDGGWTKLPLNPLYPSGLYNIQFNRLEGILGLFGSKSGPVVHLLGNTPSNTKGDLCFNAWDMHLKASPVMASRKFWAKYKLLCYSKDSCEKIEQKAEYVHYLPEEIAEYERPR